jgi:UDPglucose 6-dehydrogenase
MQDTGDTRETPAIDVCKGLTADNAKINIYDPKVTEAQIHNDLALGKFMWDHPVSNGTKSPRQDSVTVFKDPYSVCLPGSPFLHLPLLSIALSPLLWGYSSV